MAIRAPDGANKRIGLVLRTNQGLKTPPTTMFTKTLLRFICSVARDYTLIHYLIFQVAC